jgi:Aerotolerance regulator N-terminal
VSLLAPVGLGALALLPVILAIHLWRVRHRRYEVSSTLLWSRVLSETPLRRPRHFPTRYVLLALQLAALAGGAVALARPSWVAAGAHRYELVAVDTSLTMSATDVPRTGGTGDRRQATGDRSVATLTPESRLEAAKDAVRRMITALDPGDTMTLVDAGTDPRVLTTSGDHAVLAHALASLDQGYGPSSLATDGPLLAGLMPQASERPRHCRLSPVACRLREAVLFAPLGYRAQPDRAIGALRRSVPGLRVRLVGTSTDDRGVAGLTVSCATTCEADARLVNTGRHAVTTRVVATVDGAELTQRVTVPAKSAVPLRLALPAGSRVVSLRLDGHDALPADDAAWAVVPLPVHRTALLVTDDPTTPLAQALHAIPNLTLVVTTPEAYSDDMTRRVDLTVLDTTGADIAPPGNLLVINPTSSSALFTVSGTAVAPGVTAVRAGDLLLSGVDLSSLVVSSATKVRLPGWATVDVAGDAGPLLFSGTTGGRRVAVLLFDPRTTVGANASNLATLLAFPTLLQNAVRVLAPAPPSAIVAGQVAPLPVARQGVAWLQPAQDKRVILPSSGDLAALPALRPGMYSVGGGAGGAVGRIAVNAAVPGDPSAPQDGSTAAPAPHAPALPAPTVVTPWEGWAIFALLALLLLSGEWWYYVRRT